jgi:hypothetical protein
VPWARPRIAGADGTSKEIDMTQRAEHFPPGNETMPSSAPQTSVPQTASESGGVAQTAREQAGSVAGTVGDQAREVASETRTQARHLVQEGADQLRGQASDGQRRLAGSLRDLSGQLRQMSDRGEGSGLAANLVDEATQRTDQLASWLEAREPGDVVTEVRRFARRRPGLFLAGAAIAGVVVGRLTRNVLASAQDDRSGTATGQRPRTDVRSAPLPERATAPVSGYPSTPVTGDLPEQAEPWPVGTPGQTPAGQAVPGQAVPGQTVPGQTVPGQTVPGQTVPGQTTAGPVRP